MRNLPTSLNFNLSIHFLLSAILSFPKRKSSSWFRRLKMSSRTEERLWPSSGRSDSSRSSSNASSRSAQSARSAGPARESPRQNGTSTGTRPATNPFQIAQSRPLDQRPPGRGTNPRPPEDFTAPTPRNMDRESPRQQQQRQQQIPSAGPTFCGRCRARLACCSCERCIEDPANCLAAGLILSGVCCAAGGLCIGLYGFP